jgi:hypothetical protein
MNETLRGTGKLSSLGTPPKEWTVRYNFSIVTRVVERPGFPRVAAHSSSNGKVSDTNDEVIPQGVFQLEAEDGEILRVKNLGFGTWVIVAPL